MNKLLASKNEITFFSFLGGILIFLFVVSFVLGNRIHRGNVSTPGGVAASQFFDNLKLTSRAVYVLNAQNGEVLYKKNEDERLPLASITKVMTALVAIDLAPSYSTIKVTQEAVATDGDSGLIVGEEWSLKNLLDFALTSSSNDGARAIGFALGALSQAEATPKEAEADFVKKMNLKADELNMKNTYFWNDTGLDENEHKGGAYGSAKDMSTLFAYILKNHPEIMDATRRSRLTVSSLHVTHTVQNTDVLVSEIPGIKASKTGFTDLAGGNLVVAFDPEIGRPIIIAVLGSTETGRFEDMRKLIQASLQYVNQSRE